MCACELANSFERSRRDRSVTPEWPYMEVHYCPRRPNQEQEALVTLLLERPSSPAFSRRLGKDLLCKFVGPVTLAGLFTAS